MHLFNHLTSFQYIDETMYDQGAHVRKLAKEMIELLSDDAKLTDLRMRTHNVPFIRAEKKPTEKAVQKPQLPARGEAINDKQFNHYRLDRYLNELRDDFRTIGPMNPQSFKNSEIIAEDVEYQQLLINYLKHKLVGKPVDTVTSPSGQIARSDGHQVFKVLLIIQHLVHHASLQFRENLIQLSNNIQELLNVQFSNGQGEALGDKISELALEVLNKDFPVVKFSADALTLLLFESTSGTGTEALFKQVAQQSFKDEAVRAIMDYFKRIFTSQLQTRVYHAMLNIRYLIYHGSIQLLNELIESKSMIQPFVDKRTNSEKVAKIADEIYQILNNPKSIKITRRQMAETQTPVLEKNDSLNSILKLKSPTALVDEQKRALDVQNPELPKKLGDSPFEPIGTKKELIRPLPRGEDPDKKQSLADSQIDIAEVGFGGEIGRGPTAVVYKGTYAGQVVAIKKLHGKLLTKATVTAFIQEAELMKKLIYPRIVLCYGVADAENNPCLIMEYLGNNCLKSHIVDRESTVSQGLNWDIKRRMIRDIAHGMEYLHRKGVIHRDLKSSNILLEENLSCKVTNFGFSIIHTETTTKVHDRGKEGGTIQYMAPECFGLSPVFSEKSDVYAFSIVGWEICHWKIAYNGVDPGEVRYAIVKENQRLGIEDDIPADLSNLIQNCWLIQGKDRPTFTNIIKYLSTEVIGFEKPIVKEGPKLPLMIRTPAANQAAAGSPLKSASRFSSMPSLSREDLHTLTLKDDVFAESHENLNPGELNREIAKSLTEVCGNDPKLVKFPSSPYVAKIVDGDEKKIIETNNLGDLSKLSVTQATLNTGKVRFQQAHLSVTALKGEESEISVTKLNEKKEIVTVNFKVPAAIDCAQVNPNGNFVACQNKQKFYLHSFAEPNKSTTRDFPNGEIVYWSWLDQKMLVFSTKTTIYTWNNILDADTKPEKLFERLPAMEHVTITGCKQSDSWFLLIGTNKKNGEGKLQIFSFDDKRSYIYLGSSANFGKTELSHKMIDLLVSAAVHSPSEIVVSVINLNRRPLGSSYLLEVINTGTQNDYPIDIQVISPAGLILILTKHGSVIICSLDKCKCIFKTRVCDEIITVDQDFLNSTFLLLDSKSQLIGVKCLK